MVAGWAAAPRRQDAPGAGLTMPCPALSWGLRRNGITSVLIGARTPERGYQAFNALATAGSAEVGTLLDRPQTAGIRFGMQVLT